MPTKPLMVFPSPNLFEALLPSDVQFGSSEWHRSLREELRDKELEVIPSGSWMRLVSLILSAYSELFGVPPEDWTLTFASGLPPMMSEDVQFVAKQNAVLCDAGYAPDDVRSGKETLLVYAARILNHHCASTVDASVTQSGGVLSRITCGCGKTLPDRLFERHRSRTLCVNGVLFLTRDNILDMRRASLNALKTLTDTRLGIDVLDGLVKASDAFAASVEDSWAA